ncbi:MAG: Uma2 family endonuclease [Candidatus Sericytochromatia bacterium]|nr:Uma2 family endonuclease [Candidatus Sericytochromatia bacterium]
MDTAITRPRRWTRAEYEQLIDAGIFQPDEHLELLDGEILTMTPQKSRHATVVRLLQRTLEAVFTAGFDVRPQLPLALDLLSAPEPDLAVVAGAPLDYLDAHPATAVLIVEVSDTSLRLDRQRKGQLYARAGIAEYWIVNLVDGIVEVYREPVAMGNGWDYRLVQRLSRDERIIPLAKPEAGIRIGDFLPPA